ncbi:MAG TPA: cupin domain-containing protein, partial [Rubrivivax sp.]|nr:cupin domain-containing protein [Rubrivivax sp.]
MSDSPGLAALLADMAKTNTAPLWNLYANQLTREPRAPDDAYHWQWEVLAPLLERALVEVPMEHAERRVLLLSNPVFAPKTATTTHLQGGIQILNPGDHAPAHRHAAAAVRLVMEGQGAFTTVNSQRCLMEPGDLVLTPAWCWHEHVHPGSGPIAWFDGLDVPLVQALSSSFLEFGPIRDLPPTLPASVAESGLLPPEEELGERFRYHSPRFRYSGRWVVEALNVTVPHAVDGSRLLRYTNPVHGGPVMATLDCYALALAQGKPTLPYRSTANAIAVVVKGCGTSTVGDKTFAWRK